MNDPSARMSSRQKRIEKAAIDWLVKMGDNPDLHGPGLTRWMAHDPEHALAYSRVSGSADDAARAAVRIPFVRMAPSPAFDRRTSGSRWVLAGGAAVALAAAGLAVTHFYAASPRTKPIASAMTDKTYATRIGEIRAVRLADGSQVTLDTNSLIRIAFTGAERNLTLTRGRARFDVSHDPARPFIVHAGGGSVTAVGTLFDVAIGRTVTVQLLRGAVDVRSPILKDPSGRNAAVRLAAGEQTSYALATNLSASQAGTPSRSRVSDTRWVTGMQAFDDVPLSEIVEQTNRYSDTRIEIADPELAKQKLFVELDIRDTTGAVRKLAQLLHAQADLSRPGIIILKSKA